MYIFGMSHMDKLCNMNDIQARLRTLDESHRADGDGGYALVAQVRNYCSELDAEHKRLLRKELLNLVQVQDHTMWGVALEVLTQEWGRDIAGDIEKLMRESQHDQLWESQALLSLMRLGHQPIADKAIIHIMRRVSADDRTVLPLVAALSRVDSMAAVEISASFLLKLFESGDMDKVSGYVPAFVRHFGDADCSLLKNLLRALAEKNTHAEAKFAEMILKYIDRPYVWQEYGKEYVAVLKKTIGHYE